MKYLILICLALCACAKPQAVAPKRVGVSAEKCDKLYTRNLAMSLSDSDDSSYYQEQLKEALTELDSEWQMMGLTNKFYSYCLGHMTQEQVECALSADTMTAENLCQ